MFESSLPIVITVFLILGLGAFFILWFYYDRRDRALYDAQRHKRSFLCVRCGQLYGSNEPGDKVACPNCGYENPSLRF